MKINFSITEHGLTHSVTGEPNNGDDWVTYNEMAEIMSNLLSAVYGYKIYFDAHTEFSEVVKAGLNDDGQDEDFIKP
jgi:hypothetical protein